MGLGIAIMGGGAGTRLQTFTGGAPKALARFAGGTLLSHQIARCAPLRADVHVVLVSEGRGARAIAQAAAGYTPLVERTPLGTAGGLVHLPDGPRRWLVVNVDHISDVDRSALVLSAEGPCIAVTTTVETTIDEGVVNLTMVDGKPHLTAWNERPKLRVDVTTGLYVFESAALRSALDGSPCDMPDLVRRLMPQGVRAFHHSGCWFDAGTPERLRQAEAWWNTHTRAVSVA